jgi:hypothetical protein
LQMSAIDGTGSAGVGNERLKGFWREVTAALAGSLGGCLTRRGCDMVMEVAI